MASMGQTHAAFSWGNMEEQFGDSIWKDNTKLHLQRIGLGWEDEG